MHPADASVATGQSLPLSCAASTSGEVVWQRNDGSSTGLMRRNSTAYTATSGESFFIGTLVLCDIGFEEAGVYVCVNTEDNSTETVIVDVHSK